MTEPLRIDVAAERPYPVLVGRGVRARLAATVVELGAATAALVHQPALAGVAEEVRAELAAAGVDAHRVEVPDAEEGKALAVAGFCWEVCGRIGLTRSDVVVSIGGGAATDLAGFVAATWMRGVRVVHVPTTLLAMVDAAIGGKTGINLAHGKNLVGAFHQPVAVVADVGTLATLSHRVRIEGLGEVVKYGLIRDPVILELLEDDPPAARSGDLDLLTELVERSAAVKAAVVTADEFEAGERAHLNLGHTYGHAVEALTGYAQVLHGEAVAIGTLVALDAGVRMGITPPELLPRTEELLTALGLPTGAPRLDRDAVWTVMARDKKATDRVNLVVLEALGSPTVVPADRGVLDAAIDAAEERGA